MFKSIIEIFESGYQDVFGNNGLLDKKINEVYWNHLAGNILLNKYKERQTTQTFKIFLINRIRTIFYRS